MRDYPEEFDLPEEPDHAPGDIHDLVSLAQAIGCRENIGSIEKVLFKGTNCGISFCIWPEDEQTHCVLTGYAEGSDAELPHHELKFPFTEAQFWMAVKKADDEGCEEWELVNSD